MAAHPSTVPPVAELTAPPTWRTVDVASDLHLHADDTDTFDAFARYLRATPADALLLLGDVFEVWIGDDAATPGSFEARCADLLRAASDRYAVYLQHGNRDFLVGPAFLARCGATALADPTALDLFGRRWLLSHGDALCLDDTDYLRFRSEVRAPAWQQAFLARPLAERRALARGMRSESESRKRSGADYPDADAGAVARWLTASGADTLVHGHTHRPADHAVAGGRRRTVLSDWDLRATPPRAEVLRIAGGGAARVVLV
ncbi:UDP-2,3-diacylglucosamine diphosphatase [Xylophilus ampelinus]|uniref:UDP-2,3-diacylglucosamine hydrolase n=1 Tax=Xylophilus ampelinus TaxID=54067 RepID=A0A318SKB3_9BURK|nr:UDP-2,3-diacylglucosamine diphosphatase [Xylophilus ampelinus]MCS4508795.1 UDP-2,3-diacylglucosamine diphosphatase [Xylophilus ampelinus]PYE79365.1 UDP-2,3-diacylglucosamine hydrolase [Xylophilus ampelinus]